MSPNTQEQMVTTLILAEIIAAFRLLEMGGCLVLKIFTFFESSSVHFLYLLICCFKQTNIFKPVCSKGSNSEVYVVCCDYKGIDKDILKLIRLNLKNNTESMFPHDFIPIDFVQQLVECSNFFAKLQIMEIEKNISLFLNNNKDVEYLISNIRQRIVEEYLIKYNLCSIDENKKILQRKDCIASSFKYYNYRTGSHNERISVNQSIEQQIEILRNELHYFNVNYLKFGNNKWMIKISHGENIIKLYYGKPLIELKSSKLIDLSILKCWLNIKLTYKKQIEISNNDFFYVQNIKIVEVKINNYLQIKNLDQFENQVINDICKQILNSDSNEFRLKYFLVLTQLLAGFVYILANDVFKEIQFCNGEEIVFRGRKAGGHKLYGGLLQMINFQRNPNANTTHSILGLVDIVHLYKGEFYEAFINYNNSVCLKYCNVYLN